MTLDIDWQLISHYIVAILVLPIVVVTVRNVVKNSATLFDDDLTAKDRALLKQFAIFLLLPMVALFHELGHAVAAKMLGVDVIAFHWSLFFGQVELAGNRTALQDLIIALAGNIFQLVATILALLVALLLRSPAIVALSVYLYLFSGFSGLIFYPLLSLVSWDYDFNIIYGSEERGLALLIGVVHLMLVGLFAWTFLSQRARLWFAKKTRPAWAKEFDKVDARAVNEPNAVNLLSKAWQFYFVGLDKSAEESLDRAENIDDKLKDVWLLRGYLHQSRGRYRAAVLCFDQITADATSETNQINPAGSEAKVLAARGWMARGHCLAEELENRSGGQSAGQSGNQSKHKIEDYKEILRSYKQACLADLTLADPHYYLAVTLVKAGQFKEAEAEIEVCQNYAKRGLSWLDPILATMIRDVLADIRKSQKAQA